MTSKANPATDPSGSSPPFQFLADEDRRVILAPGLALTFLLAGGRWSHTLAVDVGQGLLAVIASSTEGDPTRDDPARVVSPVSQEIEQHPCDRGLCVLLTGQSTPHHFSAVVSARRDGPGSVVEFDVADRCRAPVEILAATYRVHLDPADLIDAHPEKIVWGGPGLNGGRLELAAGWGAAVALAEAGRRATRVQAIARPVPATYTHRLFYSWRWRPTSTTTT